MRRTSRRQHAKNLTPNLLLAGVPKSATTSLAEALVQGGSVSYGRYKEPGILTNPDYNLRQLSSLYGHHYNYCAPTLQYRMDATPWLLYVPELTSRLAQLQTSSWKTIVCLREPMQRMSSMYIDQVFRGREKRTYCRAIREEMDSLSVPLTRKNWSTAYVRTCFYGTAIARWQDVLQADTETKLVYFEHLMDSGSSGPVLSGLGSWLGTEVESLEHHNSRYADAGGSGLRDGLVSVASRLPPKVRVHLRRWSRRSRAGQGRRGAPVSHRRPLPTTTLPDDLKQDVAQLLAEDWQAWRPTVASIELKAGPAPEWAS